ncbi:ImmA/IrrE family metallo-endopeptidase [Halomonas sp.]|uniref:ImmA/IrrE family metallo-endopeptidase n=1 Tax=Halomonas sp. TaxID=1486246 RepID=UPI003567D2C2
MARTIQLGSQEGICLELLLESSEDKSADLVWGSGRIFVNRTAVIAGDDDASISWTWVDLLEWLAKHWPSLLLEQAFPFQMASTDILALQSDLEKRWESMAEERVEEEEEEAHRFLARHDLTQGFKGIYFPSVYLMRQGNIIEISSAECSITLRLALSKVVADLEQMGNQLAKLADVTGQGRGKLAAQRWYAREERLNQNALSLLAGLSPESLKQLHPDANNSTYWEFDARSPLNDTELLAAARMTHSVLLPDQQHQLLEQVRMIPKGATPSLDALAASLIHDFEGSGKPHDQGYWAATWLRHELAYELHEPINLIELLQRWGVDVQEIEIPDTSLDALACWGPRHGPAVLLNTASQSTAAHIHGKNSTLAHEICHLLMDRDSALPVAEVLNGNTPERLEKRARAFAAELLLPRSVAANKVKTGEDLKEVIDDLSQTYQVSLELVSWQIINSDIYTALNANEQRWLRNRVSRDFHAT